MSTIVDAEEPAAAPPSEGLRTLWPLLVIMVGLTMSALWSLGLLWALYLGLRWMSGG